MNTDDNTDRHQQSLSIARDHPVFPGHFPDAPVVPGVLLLSQILDVAEQWLGTAARPIRLRQAKFPAPWLPGMTVQAILERDGRLLRFQVATDNQVLARGVFELQAVTDSPGEST